MINDTHTPFGGNPAPQKKEFKKSSKEAQLIAGTDRLFARRKPGQCFTPSEIGRECGMHNRAITFIERQALYKFAHGLHQAAPDFFQAVLGEKEMKEVFGRLNPQVTRTGKAAVRVAKLRHFAKEKSLSGSGVMTLEEIGNELSRRKGLPRYGRTSANRNEPASVKMKRRVSKEDHSYDYILRRGAAGRPLRRCDRRHPTAAELMKGTASS